MSLKFVDAHCHLHEFLETTIEHFKDIIIVAVSDDEPSSIKTLQLAEKFNNVIPCVGIHPWYVDKVGFDELRRIEKIIANAKCIGEVGLDKKFVPETYPRQLEFFKEFLRLAREYSLPMNIHAAGTWNEVLELLRKYDIEKALFHWYTGPLNLIDEIVSMRYYISINVALKIQEKHKKVVEYAPLTHMLTESDGPYDYRGIKLEPTLIKSVVEWISRIKKYDFETVKETIYYNLKKFLRI